MIAPRKEELQALGAKAVEAGGCAPPVVVSSDPSYEAQARELLANAPVTRFIGHDFVPKEAAVRAIAAAIRQRPAVDDAVADHHANAALSHLSNALDDLVSSPDQRPVPLIREAMAHVRELRAALAAVRGAK